MTAVQQPDVGGGAAAAAAGMGFDADPSELGIQPTVTKELELVLNLLRVVSKDLGDKVGWFAGPAKPRQRERERERAVVCAAPG